MNNHETAALVVSVCGALIPLVLLGGGSVQAWRRLARLYPDQPFEIEASFRSVSGLIGGTYIFCGGLLHLDIGSTGLRISPLRPFRRLLPPLYLPWSEITRCEIVRLLPWHKGLKLTFARWPAPTCLHSQLWRNEALVPTIQTRWQKMGTAAEAVSPR